MTRKSLPSIHKIASWWASEQGQERVNQIKRDYEVCLIDKLSNIDLDSAHCWACDKTLRSGCSNYRTRDLGLHRCHVIPDCLGGSNDPSNIILMCAECHKDNPDSTDESLFWWWFKNVESDYLQKADRLIKILPSSLNDEEADEILKEFKSDLTKTDTVPVSGRLGWGFVTASISRIVSSLEVQQSSSVGASSQDVASSLLSEFTEHKNKRISQRTKEAMQYLISEGRFTGRAPRGFTVEVRDDGKKYLVIDTQEQADQEMVRSWKREGFTNAEMIAMCETQGITSRSGKAPSQATISRWTKGVEAPERVKAERKVSNPNLLGRKARPRLEDQLTGLLPLIQSLLSQGMSHAKVTEEVEKAGYRTSKGKAIRKSQISLIIKRNEDDSKSKYTGGIPLGWRVDEDGNEVPDEIEQSLIALVREYRDLGLSYSAIAQKLTEANFSSRTGNAKFSKSMAKRINDAETTAERTLRLQASFKVTHNRMSKDDGT